MNTRSEVAVAGIKPTGTPHIGNYLSAIASGLDFARGKQEIYYFIANYHALNAVKDPKRLQRETLEVAATWLACGLDPNKVTFYQQSDIPEIFEITVILMAYTAKGFLNRAHAYKASVDTNRTRGRDEDDGVNMGLFNYPVMMAADILAFKGERVPVGKDQTQHIEMTQDIAEAFNRGVNASCLPIPKALINPSVETVIGTDGRKMSKSYGNTIPLFGEEKVLRKTIMQIVTTSQSIEEPKDPETCNVYSLYEHFAQADECTALAKRYRSGGMGWGEAKEALFTVMSRELKAKRERYLEFIADEDALWRMLREGAEKARARASQTLAEMKHLAGLHT